MGCVGGCLSLVCMLVGVTVCVCFMELFVLCETSGAKCAIYIECIYILNLHLRKSLKMG